MSTKCTVLCGDNYHFFYDYADSQYHLTFEKDGDKDFYRRAGELLAGCPLSDSGIYLVSLKGEETKRFNHKMKCKKLEEAKEK